MDNNPKTRQPPKIRECANCKNLFTYVGNHTPLYCCRECYYAAQKRKRERVCKQCGKTFHTPSANRPTTFCSVRCSTDFRKGELYKPDAIRVHKQANGKPNILYSSDYPKGIREHRYIMQRHLGRKLLRHELVVHKDGNVRNNDIDNLAITYCVRDARFRKKTTDYIEQAKQDRKSFNALLNKVFSRLD